MLPKGKRRMDALNLNALNVKRESRISIIENALISVEDVNDRNRKW